MGNYPTVFGRFKQPFSAGLARYGFAMSNSGKLSRMVIRDNVLSLMTHQWGETNLSRLARDAKIGLGTAARIAEGNTSVGADIVEKVADVFGLPAWALMIPDLDPKNPPKSWLSQSDSDRYQRALAAARDLAAH